MACIRDVPLKIFEEETTYRNNYVNHKQGIPKKYDMYHTFERKQHVRKKPTKPYIPLDIHTMQPYVCMAPFDTLWTPKEITRTHPAQTHDLSIKLEDLGREESIKTRKRVYMLPQVSLDDTKEPAMRKLITDNMYISDWNKISSDVKHTYTKRDIPNTVLENSKQTKVQLFIAYVYFIVGFIYNMIRYWPVEWEKHLKEWEAQYPTHIADLTDVYWKDYKHKLNNTPIGMDPMKNYTTIETRQEIKELIEKDRLRLAYDKIKLGYTGFRPQYDDGRLAKNEFDLIRNPFRPKSEKN